MAEATTTQPPQNGAANERVEMARTQIARAFALEGLVRDGNPICPSCGTSTKGKVKLFSDGGVKCHKCKWYARNAVDLLCNSRVRVPGAGIVGVVVEQTDSQITYRDRAGAEHVADAASVGVEGGEWLFSQAVRALLGEDHRAPEGRTPCELPEVDLTPAFVANPDPEVYECVLGAGDTDAAVAFYERFGISAEVTVASRATRIVDQGKLRSVLLSQFGAERIIAAGLATEKGFLLVNDRYPIVEPHLTPSGLAAGLQFRGSEVIEERAKEHARYKRQREAVEETGGTWRGQKVPHVPKFLSIQGAPLRSRCGFGLPRIAAAAGSGRKLWIVEGFKDTLATESFGLLAYGLAGAGLLPVRAVADMLRGFKVSVAFDGDKAGRDGAAAIIEHLGTNFGIDVDVKELPDGCDVTDMLMKSKGLKD
jgi:hypothetical protein